ncbi:MAG: PEP-CTERM sorting domain-containing protein [Planctomycetota bacterium]
MAALAASAGFGVATHGQVLVSDSFDRTTGNNIEPVDPADPPLLSDWGANDNASGGTLGSATYTVSNPGGAFDIERTDGDNGVIAFGRTILPINLATPDVIAAGGVSVKVDLSPSDIGLGAFHGRDWLGFVLIDTLDGASIGGSGALFGGNPDSRVGVGVRNSGSAITRAIGGTGVKSAGNPDSAGFNEPIFDQPTWDEYVLWQDGADGTASGDPVEAFPSDRVYTVEMIVTAAPGDLFADGATHFVELLIGIDGGPLTSVPLDPANPLLNTFEWGDNITTVGPNGGTDPNPGARDAYIAFVANANGGHLFDNLVVTAVPEPASFALLGLGGAALAARRRRG